MADLSRKRERERLKTRREPYWQRLTKGQYLGFRKGPDSWVARLRDRTGKQHYQALTSATEYDEAKQAAERWFEQMGTAPVRKLARGTVKEALQTYLTYLREQNRADTAKVAERKFKQLVWDDPLAEIPLQGLTREDVREWRERLCEGRQPHSVNRIMRDFQAGLNRAVKEGHVGDPQAWRLDPLAEDAGAETAVFLDPAQRKAIIDNAIPEAAAFFRGLEETGARPGELSKARVSDFNSDARTLRLVHKKGRPPKPRPRAVFLGQDGAAFFKEQAKNKLPDAYLFTDNGKPWRRERWGEEFRVARAVVNARAKGRHRVPPGASAYSFRHARISELLQVHQIDPMTVAAQTGTSMAMLEKAYYKFIPTAMQDKLDAVKESAR